MQKKTKPKTLNPKVNPKPPTNTLKESEVRASRRRLAARGPGGHQGYIGLEQGLRGF